jgi:hypothetical protein
MPARRANARRERKDVVAVENCTGGISSEWSAGWSVGEATGLVTTSVTQNTRKPVKKTQRQIRVGAT